MLVGGLMGQSSKWDVMGGGNNGIKPRRGCNGNGRNGGERCNGRGRNGNKPPISNL